MKQLIWIVAILILAGCTSTKSGVEKKYDVAIKVDNQSTATFYMGVEADTAASTRSGDAPATSSIDPAIALGMQGSTTSAAAKGAEQVLRDIVSYAEQWFKKDAENVDNSREETTNEAAKPEVPDESGGLPGVVVPDPQVSIDPPLTGDWKVVNTYECEGTMSYRECDTCTSVPQKVCLMTNYKTAQDIPYQSFKLIWQEGMVTEELMVPNKNNVAMTHDDFRKYRHAHDKSPFNPVGYAPRGMNPERMFMVVK